MLAALTLRRAVAAVSPIIGDFLADFPVLNLNIGLLGILPPFLFAASRSSLRSRADCAARTLV